MQSFVKRSKPAEQQAADLRSACQTILQERANLLRERKRAVDKAAELQSQSDALGEASEERDEALSDLRRRVVQFRKKLPGCVRKATKVNESWQGRLSSLQHLQEEFQDDRSKRDFDYYQYRWWDDLTDHYGQLHRTQEDLCTELQAVQEEATRDARALATLLSEESKTWIQLQLVFRAAADASWHRYRPQVLSSTPIKEQQRQCRKLQDELNSTCSEVERIRLLESETCGKSKASSGKWLQSISCNIS